MEVREARFDGSIILSPSGRIDLTNAEGFKELLLQAVAAARETLVLDLSEVDYISSAGLRSIMIASKTGKPNGITLGIASMRPVVKEIFSISRFDLVFPCFETTRDALAQLSPHALEAFGSG
jgi:anti-sigma B factor antagonist/stage II sporulation protein AA (anti-sigma F factor antagonist)